MRRRVESYVTERPNTSENDRLLREIKEVVESVTSPLEQRLKTHVDAMSSDLKQFMKENFSPKP
jgi:hypothetical protein